MTDNYDVVLRALLAEGEEKVNRLVRRGRTPDKAISEVASDMDLTPVEADALKSKVKNPPPAASKDVESPSTGSDSKPSEDSIFFENNEEADQAAGILMYKGIPWKSKGSTFIQFETHENMDKAHDALKRRWDFVESEDRRTAVIEFDSLGDYERVLEYMRKQNMLLNFGGDHELAEDVAIEAAKRKTEGKRKSRNPDRDVLGEDEVRSKDNCYRAVNRGKQEDDVNPWDNRGQRVVKVRKRWR